MLRCTFSGAATIRIEMPGHMENSLIFHYNLKFYGNEGKDSYEGVSLKRSVQFRIHISGNSNFFVPAWK